jgi:hypothetical protein
MCAWTVVSYATFTSNKDTLMVSLQPLMVIGQMLEVDHVMQSTASHEKPA